MMHDTNQFFGILKSGKSGKYVLARVDMKKDVKQISTDSLKKIWKRGGLAFHGFVFTEGYDFFKVWVDDGKGGKKIDEEMQFNLYLAAIFYDWKLKQKHYMFLDDCDFKTFGRLMGTTGSWGDVLYRMDGIGSAPNDPWYENFVTIDNKGNPCAIENSEEAK